MMTQELNPTLNYDILQGKFQQKNKPIQQSKIQDEWKKFSKTWE